MRKENCMCLLFAGAVPLFFIGHSTVAADEVVMIPLFTTETCTASDEVKSAGHCWKNRNLGASRVATSFDDNAAFGDHYQWGRSRDGHQNLLSAPTTAISENDVPGHSAFIITNPLSPSDWRKPRNDNLWQGLGGVNNPCPQGFRLPTYTELENESLSWVSHDLEGAFLSFLKLVAAGSRRNTDGSYIQVGDTGRYWSSTVNGSASWFLSIRINSNGGATMSSSARANGFSIRCLKD